MSAPEGGLKAEVIRLAASRVFHYPKKWSCIKTENGPDRGVTAAETA
jgi:hypothetical protein